MEGTTSPENLGQTPQKVLAVLTDKMANKLLELTHTNENNNKPLG